MLNQPTDQTALSNGDVYFQQSPWARNEERLVSESLLIATVPSGTIRRLVQPRNPLFPPRYGYMSYTARQAGIEEILDEKRNYRNRRYDISGGPADIQSSSRNVGAATW